MNRYARRFAACQRPCPKCGAPAGVSCSNNRGDERRAVHQQRLAGVTKAALSAVPVSTSEAFYGSDAWRRVRYRALRRHGGLCQCCGTPPKVGAPLHVDHIKPRSRFPELALELSNLQVMCVDCNLGKGASDTIDWRARA